MFNIAGIFFNSLRSTPEVTSGQQGGTLSRVTDPYSGEVCKKYSYQNVLEGDIESPPASGLLACS